MSQKLQPGQVEVTKSGTAGWAVRYVDNEGKENTVYRKQESQARYHAMQIEAILKSPAAQAVDFSEMVEVTKSRDSRSLEAWADVLWAGIKLVSQHPHNEDVKSAVKVISSAATSARKFLTAGTAVDEDDLTGLSDEELVEKAMTGLKGFAESLPKEKGIKLLGKK